MNISSLCAEEARHRGVSTKKRSWQRYEGQERARRAISPTLVKFTEEKIAEHYVLNSTRRRAIFHAAQLLSCFEWKRGAGVPQHAFSSEKIGRFIQESITECGIARCLDWHSWLPTGCDFRNAKARAFIPSWEFIWADIGLEVICNYADYCRGNYQAREPLHHETELVHLDPSSGVEIPFPILQALNQGTGFLCDFKKMHDLLLQLPESQRSCKLAAAIVAVGRAPDDNIHPVWVQHSWGRLYCKKPAFINMPKALLPSLRSVTGKPIWNVDFSSFELRIACQITGQRLTEGDAYKQIGQSCGLSRERTKPVVNPMLHGQTPQQLWYAREADDHIKEDRPLVEKAMAEQLPRLYSGLEKLRQNPSTLQNRGAHIFFQCMGKAMETCEIGVGGLPKHDGWIFPATKAQAKEVCAVFQEEAQRMTGGYFPVKLEAVA